MHTLECRHTGQPTVHPAHVLVLLKTRKPRLNTGRKGQTKTVTNKLNKSNTYDLVTEQFTKHYIANKKIKKENLQRMAKYYTAQEARGSPPPPCVWMEAQGTQVTDLQAGNDKSVGHKTLPALAIHTQHLRRVQIHRQTTTHTCILLPHTTDTSIVHNALL